jgi:hypothetical protein
MATANSWVVQGVSAGVLRNSFLTNPLAPPAPVHHCALQALGC